MQQQKCTNCGAKDHVAKFCYERAKKIPTIVKKSIHKTDIIDKPKNIVDDNKQDVITTITTTTTQIPNSKYEEDKYYGEHTQVWGSYWNEVLGWGFACCYSNQKIKECQGEKGKRQSLTKEYVIKRSIEETPLAQQELKSGPLNLDELYRKSNLREGAPVDVIVQQQQQQQQSTNK